MKRIITQIVGTIITIVGFGLMLNSFTGGGITGLTIAGDFARGLVGSILGMGFIIGGVLLIVMSSKKNYPYKSDSKKQYPYKSDSKKSDAR